jgi:hypothetical protein
MMQVTHQTRVYLRGLLAAIIGGAANSVTVMIVDPTNFNLFEGGAVKLGTVALVSAIVSAALYLKEHPLPSFDDTDYNILAPQRIADIESGTGVRTPLPATGTGDGK